ncbi:hypothetical protein [Shewanella sedimentimangrovi]|uniref:Uncharacterized protein n=1 Tax=Shewanella sedimentimangrovi TaxID=2814293 RepID=A0ABX7R378_9GAMM|nr:hypothetical protein [Shewanella sedimentimangrovi]QSX37616.1 hypothetical protein JYB85_01910 [Shewanella sedimentimangrovi]
MAHMLLLGMILFVFTVVPVRISASVFGAECTGLGACAMAVAMGTLVSLVLAFTIGGLWAIILSYLSMSYVYSKYLGFSTQGSLLFTSGVIMFQLAIFQFSQDLVKSLFF